MTTTITPDPNFPKHHFQVTRHDWACHIVEHYGDKMIGFKTIGGHFDTDADAVDYYRNGSDD